ncbi:MAG: hypothetical protein M1827_007475 [Pycnora praestabilis]|nr:MAG: hypothetical protein M1827_007475 [Pycnora praestabilis]
MDGYHKMADLMSQFPEIVIFRRFSALNVRNLLYLQAELAELDNELHHIAVEDSNSDDAQRKLYSTQWWTLNQSMYHGDSLQWKKVLQIRDKVKEYNAALLQINQTSALRQPEPRNLGILRAWLQRARGGNCALRGMEATVWDPAYTSDLVALSHKVEKNDPFTMWIVKGFLSFFHIHLGHWLLVKSLNILNI